MDKYLCGPNGRHLKMLWSLVKKKEDCTKTKGTLELIHSDVCGPMPSMSLSVYEYYVKFIDDYSRKTWIYFLKTKSEVFGKFKQFKAFHREPFKKKNQDTQIRKWWRIYFKII